MHLFPDCSDKLCLELFDQDLITGPAVLLREFFGILCHDDAADAVQLPANRGKLDQDLGTVRIALDHAPHQPDMADGTRHTVGNIMRVVLSRFFVIVHLRSFPLFQIGCILILPVIARNPGGGL